MMEMQKANRVQQSQSQSVDYDDSSVVGFGTSSVPSPSRSPSKKAITSTDGNELDP